MKTVLRVARLGLVAVFAVAVTGCCISPLGVGHGHGRGHYQNSGR